MNLSSDQQILWQHGFIKLNTTIVTTWALMLVMTIGAQLITRRLVSEDAISRWQAALEIIVTGIGGGFDSKFGNITIFGSDNSCGRSIRVNITRSLTTPCNRLSRL